MPVMPRRAFLGPAILMSVLALAQGACSIWAETTSAPALAPSPSQETVSIPTRAPTQPPVTTAEPPSLPDRPLSSSGPWYVFASDDRLWALNPDGSGLTSLWDIYGEGLNIVELILWPAPRGGRVAIVHIEQRIVHSAPVLKLLELPSGRLRTIANLLPREVDYEALDLEARDAANQVWAAVGPRNHLAWSSDGRLLAFNAAIDGPSADVYVYDTATEEIARLTDGPNLSTDLEWSPDDEYIVHGVARTLNYDHSGAGYDMLGVWAASRDPGEAALRIFDHAFIGYEQILGWLDDSRYVGDSWDGEHLSNCGSFGLRTVDIRDGAGPVLLEGFYNWRAFDRETRMVLLVVSSILQQWDCSASLDTGVYLFDIDSEEAQLLPDIDPDSIESVTWNEAAGLFFLGSSSELVAVDPVGNVRSYPSLASPSDIPPVVGPSGDVWALSNYSGALGVGTRTGQFVELDVQGAETPFWSADEDWLFFFVDGLYLYGAPAPDFEPAIHMLDALSPQRPVVVNP